MRWFEVFGETQRVDELFDNGIADWKWTDTDEWQMFASFQVGECTYEVVCEKEIDEGLNAYSVSFYDKNPAPGEDKIGNLGTQKSRSIQVFSTVIDVVKSLIKHQNPDVITFAGEQDTGKSSLYGAMLKRFSKEIASQGYVASSSTMSQFTHFELRRSSPQE